MTFNSTTKASGVVPQIALDPEAERRWFQNVTHQDLIFSIWNSCLVATFNDSRPLPARFDATNMDAEVLLILRGHLELTVDDLLDTDVYLNLSQVFYKRILAQKTRHYLTAAGNSTVIWGP